MTNTRVMCVIQKFQPKEKLDHVGASTRRGSGQLSITSVCTRSFGEMGKFSIHTAMDEKNLQTIPELCAQASLPLLKHSTQICDKERSV